MSALKQPHQRRETLRPAPLPDQYIEPDQPGALERDERMLAEWVKGYQIAKDHVVSEKEVLDEMLKEVKADKRSGAAELRSKISTYILLHKETLDSGLYHRMQDILFKLRQIETQTRTVDPSRATQVRGMIAELREEWQEASSTFHERSLEAFRLAEESAWKEVVAVHEAWSGKRGGEVDHLFARLANMIGVVRKVPDTRLDLAAAAKTAKQVPKRRELDAAV